MKQAWPWFTAVALGYVLLAGVSLYMLPKPWNFVVALVVVLMAVRFLFTIRKVSQLGLKSRPK